MVTETPPRKRRLIKTLAIVGAILLGLPTIAWFSAPSFIKWYVPRKVPGVTISDVQLHLNGTADAYGVSVKRKGVQGKLDWVHVDLNSKKVDAEKGKVEVDLDEIKSSDRKRGTKESNRWRFSFRQIDADVSATFKGRATGSIRSASYDGQEICFDSASVEHPKLLRLSLGRSCVRKEKAGNISEAEIGIKLPIHIPKVKEEQTVKITNIAFDVPKRSFSFSLATLSESDKKAHSSLFGGQVSVTDDVVSAKVELTSTTHRWLSEKGDQWKISNAHITYPRKGGTIILGAEGWKGNEIKILVDRKPWHIRSSGVQCSDWLSIGNPSSGPNNFDEMSGVFEFDISVSPPALKIKNSCKMSCDDPIIDGLHSEFSYYVVDAQGNAVERKTGPRVYNWTPLTSMAPETHEAVVMMEDPAFERHHGYLRLALLASLKINLEAGRFVRGGSTITMQLVKNIWLGREKTLDRKLREIILARMLEGCLSKYEIIELYMNVVEFGPGIYGIGSAAKEYFDKSPALLEPDEAMFLAMALPRPSRVVHPKDGGMKRVHGFMRRWEKMDKLPEEFRGFDDETEPEEYATEVEGAGVEPPVRDE